MFNAQSYLRNSNFFSGLALGIEETDINLISKKFFYKKSRVHKYPFPEFFSELFTVCILAT